MFYAVKNGKVPGIYETWPECEAQVKGFNGAIYKKFKNKDDAESFMNGVDPTKTELVLPNVYAFVDGSFNPTTKIYGYGGFVVVNGTKHILQGSGDDPAIVEMNNVSGELAGSMAAISFAIEQGLPEITILYDYQGIESWTNGDWRTNKEGTKAYKKFFEENSKKINIKFQKVTAHTGVPGNEEADKLAKEAVGIK